MEKVQEEFDMDAPTTTLTDEAGRTLTCYIEDTVTIEEQEYVVLLPVDAPVEVFTWEEDEDEDEEEAVLVETDEDIDRIFSTAKAVLEEQNLTLKRTAITLTVEGSLPDFDEEYETEEEIESEDGEELHHLASFYHQDKEYVIYAPLDPFLILARLDATGRPQLLSSEEFEAIKPHLNQIEEHLLFAEEE